MKTRYNWSVVWFQGTLARMISRGFSSRPTGSTRTCETSCQPWSQYSSISPGPWKEGLNQQTKSERQNTTDNTRTKNLVQLTMQNKRNNRKYLWRNNWSSGCWTWQGWRRWNTKNDFLYRTSETVVFSPRGPLVSKRINEGCCCINTKLFFKFILKDTDCEMK